MTSTLAIMDTIPWSRPHLTPLSGTGGALQRTKPASATREKTTTSAMKVHYKTPVDTTSHFKSMMNEFFKSTLPVS